MIFLSSRKSCATGNTDGVGIPVADAPLIPALTEKYVMEIQDRLPDRCGGNSTFSEIMSPSGQGDGAGNGQHIVCKT